MAKLKDFKPGDRIKIIYEEKTTMADIITMDDNNAPNQALLGWKKGEELKNLGWPPRSDGHVVTTYDVLRKGYVRVAWFNLEREAELVTASSATIYKSKVVYICTTCHSSNPFAEPNQKDGTYKCYECR